jgi:hypothetical protein
LFVNNSFQEIVKGRESFSDKKAREVTRNVLRDMIASFLADYYPDMPLRERQAMAQRMDLSLVERKKEEVIKSFFEMNSTIRMSWIEMQYMKKVGFK